MVKALNKVRSFSYDMLIDLDMDLVDDGDRENINTSIDIKGDLSVEDKIMCSNINAIFDRDSEKMKMYAKFDGNNIDLYTYDYNFSDWEKGRINSDAMQAFESNERSVLAEGVIQNKSIDKTELDGVKVFVLDMIIDISALKDHIEQTSNETWTSMIRDYADDLDVTVGELLSAFENLKATNVRMYIDRKTDLPLRVELDANKSLNSFMENIIKLLDKYGEENIGFETTKSTLIIDFESYNNADISIPNEAYNGYDNGIIKLTD